MGKRAIRYKAAARRYRDDARGRSFDFSAALARSSRAEATGKKGAA